MENQIRNMLVIFLFVLIIYLLSVLSSILLPLVFALLFAIIFQPLVIYLSEKKIPKWLILPAIAIISLSILTGIALVISSTTQQIIEVQDYLLNQLNYKAQNSIDWFNSLFGLNYNAEMITDEIFSGIDTEWISSTAGGIAKGLGSFAGSFALFALYYILLLSGMSNYKRYITYVGGDDGSQLLKQYENIQRSIYSYIIIKTLISLITGILAYIICVSFGIKFAIFWAFLTFLFNYIPSIGSITATIFPVLMAIIQFDSVKKILLILVLLGTIQFLMGNFFEPMIMGNRLRLNTPTVIFGLVFWGYIWGVAGMILSVPLLVILKIILERFPAFSIVGRIMGYPDKSFEST
jgi:AI-2 transport protein TqsA